MPNTPNKLNIFKVATGLSLARKNPKIWIAIQMEKNIISFAVKLYFMEFTKIIIPKAM
ncbi:hypothetical protein JCM19302_3716 [Jejuia pallidilutea]|uniref:Uncharacterized protein n=1 Tax=Jejuia pallidilutea TaxID=504487 RepID=A0A090WQ45_9FLAO|nr:hypothetical protein JCM19302_3716 [Jejuia pallidilutea]